MADSSSSEDERLPRTEEEGLSKMRHSISQYGDKSYYYAHARKMEVPEDAKVVSGPGLITGGKPVLLKSEPSVASTDATKRVKIVSYSWSDEGAAVKVYLSDSALLEFLDKGAEVSLAETTEFSLRLNIRLDGVVHFLHIEELNAEIDPAEAKHRLSAGKRLTLTLKKKNADKKWYSLKADDKK